MKKLYLCLAVVFGLGVIIWMFLWNGGWESLRPVEVNARLIIGLTLAVLCFVVQNISMAYRYEFLSSRHLNFLQSMRVNILSEFVSAVTPSVVGGSSVNFLFMNREGMSLGRSGFVSLISLFYDEFFLAVSTIVIYCVVPHDLLFGHLAVLSDGIQYLFFGAMVVIGLYSLVLFAAIFYRPQIIADLLRLLLVFPFLRKLKPKLDKFSQDTVAASKQAKECGWQFWVGAFVNTLVSWGARYAVVIIILWAFGASGNLLIAYAQQWILWIVMLVTPTPGGSGFSEVIFREYYAAYLPTVGITVVVALVWRLIFYYSYLIAGALTFPELLKKRSSK